MALRQMVGQRKGSTLTRNAIHPGSDGPDSSPKDQAAFGRGDQGDGGGPSDKDAAIPAQGQGSDGEGQADAVECPNCRCQFDPESGDIVAMPEAADVEAEGIDLGQSAAPVPGKFGSAADGARGTDAMAHLLGSLTGGR